MSDEIVALAWPTPPVPVPRWKASGRYGRWLPENLTSAKMPIDQTLANCPRGWQQRGKKLTIPHPFSMTKRDAIKQVDRQSTRMPGGDFDQDEIECLKKFRANVVPAHTFLPLYDDMVREEARKQQTRNRMRRQGNLANQQPFSFVTPQNASDRRRSKSASDVGRNPRNIVVNDRATSSSTTMTFSELTEENELLREIRIKARAEKLLKQSALPAAIQEHQDRVLIKRQLAHAKIAQHMASSSAPVKGIHRSVGILASSPKPAPTVRTCRADTPKILDNFSRLGRHRSHSLSELRDTGGFVFAPRMNETTRKRDAANRKRNQGDVNGNMYRNDTWGLKKVVVQSIMQLPISSPEEKVSILRRADRVRGIEYTQELKDMLTRVKSKPLLIERQTQASAKNQVEKKFKQSLEKHGLDLNFIVANSIKGKKQEQVSSSSDASGEDEKSVDHSFEEDDQDASESGSKESGSEYETETVASESGRSSKGSEEPERIPEHDM